MDHMTLNIVLRARIPGAVKMETVMQSKDYKKCIKMCISLYHPDFCRVLVSRPDVWRLHECIRLQLLVSHADEPDYFLGGSLEFVAVSMLLAPYAPVQVFQLVF